MAIWWHTALPVLCTTLADPHPNCSGLRPFCGGCGGAGGPSQIKTFAHKLHQAYATGTPWAEVLAGAAGLLALGLLAFSSKLASVKGVRALQSQAAFTAAYRP